MCKTIVNKCYYYNFCMQVFSYKSGRKRVHSSSFYKDKNKERKRKIVLTLYQIYSFYIVHCTVCMHQNLSQKSESRIRMDCGRLRIILCRVQTVQNIKCEMERVGQRAWKDNKQFFFWNKLIFNDNTKRFPQCELRN